MFLKIVLCVLLLPSLLFAETGRLDIVNEVLLEIRPDVEVKEGGICVFKEKGDPFSPHLMLECETLLANLLLLDTELPLGISPKLVNSLFQYADSLLDSLYQDQLVLDVEKEEDATIFAKVFIYLSRINYAQPNLGIDLKIRNFYREQFQRIAPIFESLKDEISVSKLIAEFVGGWKEDGVREKNEFMQFYLRWVTEVHSDFSLLKLLERFSETSPDEMILATKTAFVSKGNHGEEDVHVQELLQMPNECIEGGLVSLGSDCSLLEALPNEIKNKIIESYLVSFKARLQSLKDLSKDFSVGVVPSYISSSSLYETFSVDVLYPILIKRAWLGGDILDRLALKNMVFAERSELRPKDTKIFNIFNVLFSFGLLIGVGILCGYRYILKDKGDSNTVNLTLEERNELRELKKYFGVVPSASLKDLSKSYRLKVRESHPDAGQADASLFLEMQNKYNRLKQLQTCFLFEKKQT